MPFDLKELVSHRLGENYALHDRHLNRTLVKVLRTIGFDNVYANGRGAYLYDRDNREYLDFLSGYSAFNIGRNHPAVKEAIRQVLEMDLPNMVQMDCSVLSGLLAEVLVQKTPRQLDAVFFCNSGTEAIEGALKFARVATGRSRVISLEGAFHGLTYGALSLMGIPEFRDGFGPFLPNCERVALGDLSRLEAALETGDVAALIIEPVQGKSVKYPEDDFFPRAQELCRKHGTLLVSDEIQAGLGRTGRWFGFQHWDLEPDIITLAKSLGGGYVPCGAILTRRDIHQRMFSRMDRCVVHSTTFGRNNLAMACGLATLQVLEDESLVENAASMGDLLLRELTRLQGEYSFIKEARGKGLMVAVEFREPTEFPTKMGWRLLQRVDPNLFTQMIVTALLRRHRILTQVAAHGTPVLKILPPLVITEHEVHTFVHALKDVLDGCRRFPGPIWELAKGFLSQAIAPKRGR